ncbi:MAG: hypothetical protein IIA00_07145 [Proteobacteria bacterium]|nr:hypothetical protein [Pseudomonadota bacterium]
MEPPSHYHPDRAKDWAYSPDQRAIFEAARRWRKERAIAPAAADAFTVEVVAVDVQKDFCFPEGSLYVAGRGGALREAQARHTRAA